MITDELLDTFASEPKLVNYMDIPIQHVNDAILRRMNRRGTRAELDEMLQKLRSRLPTPSSARASSRPARRGRGRVRRALCLAP